jgi:hypothetical protein
MVKDKFFLVAATVGGFVLSITLSGILRGTPITSSATHESLNSYPVASVQFVESKK